MIHFYFKLVHYLTNIENSMESLILKRSIGLVYLILLISISLYSIVDCANDEVAPSTAWLSSFIGPLPFIGRLQVIYQQLTCYSDIEEYPKNVLSEYNLYFNRFFSKQSIIYEMILCFFIILIDNSKRFVERTIDCTFFAVHSLTLYGFGRLFSLLKPRNYIYKDNDVAKGKAPGVSQPWCISGHIFHIVTWLSIFLYKIYWRNYYNSGSSESVILRRAITLAITYYLFSLLNLVWFTFSYYHSAIDVMLGIGLGFVYSTILCYFYFNVAKVKLLKLYLKLNRKSIMGTTSFNPKKSMTDPGKKAITLFEFLIQEIFNKKDITKAKREETERQLTQFKSTMEQLKQRYLDAVEHQKSLTLVDKSFNRKADFTNAAESEQLDKNKERNSKLQSSYLTFSNQLCDIVSKEDFIVKFEEAKKTLSTEVQDADNLSTVLRKKIFHELDDVIEEILNSKDEISKMLNKVNESYKPEKEVPLPPGKTKNPLEKQKTPYPYKSKKKEKTVR